MDNDQLLQVVDQRVARMVQLGTVHAVDLDAGRARVKVGEVITTWLPWLTPRAGDDRSWWPLSVNEQVAVIAPDGELGAGIILGSLFQASSSAPSHERVHRTHYADGAVVGYDPATHRLEAQLPAGGRIVVSAPAGLVVTGDLEVNGDLEVSGALQANSVADVVRSLAADRAIYNGHTHAVTPPAGPTLPPLPLQ